MLNGYHNAMYLSNSRYVDNVAIVCNDRILLN